MVRGEFGHGTHNGVRPHRESVMDPTDNKSVATNFFARFNANDTAGALAALSDDATWWVAGRPGAHPFVGTK